MKIYKVDLEYKRFIECPYEGQILEDCEIDDIDSVEFFDTEPKAQEWCESHGHKTDTYNEYWVDIVPDKDYEDNEYIDLSNATYRIREVELK